MARKSRSKTGIGIWLGGIIVCALAAGVAYYVIAGSAQRARPAGKPSGPQGTLFLPKETPDGFGLVPVERSCPRGAKKMEESLRALLSTNRESGLVQNLIPKGTRLLGVRISEGVAEVNLSRDFVDNFAGGSDQEALTLNAIVATAVRNSDGRAKRVRILVEGESVESLGGHFDLSGTLSPDARIVRQREDN